MMIWLWKRLVMVIIMRIADCLEDMSRKGQYGVVVTGESSNIGGGVV
jgi:hypothetical protein